MDTGPFQGCGLVCSGFQQHSALPVTPTCSSLLAEWALLCRRNPEMPIMSFLFLSPTAPCWRCQAGKKPLNTRQGRRHYLEQQPSNGQQLHVICIITHLCERAEQL